MGRKYLEPKSEPQRVAVTGCAGFIGSQLAEYLLDEGIEVVGIDSFNDNYGREEKQRNLEVARAYEGFEFHAIDLAEADLAPVLDGVEVVYHLAGEPGVRSSWGSEFRRYVRNNLIATQELLRVMSGAPDRRVVYASSSSIYGQAARLPTGEDVTPTPYSPYGVTKLGGEHLCNVYYANYGLEVVSLRYFTVFGPRQRPDMAFRIFCDRAVSGEEIAVFGDGTQTRDFTFVADVVTATRKAATAGIEAGGAYNVGGGLRASLRDVLATIEEIVGRELDVVFRPTQAGDVKATGADTTKARADLNFAPSTSLRDGIAAEFAWVSSEISARAVG